MRRLQPAATKRSYHRFPCGQPWPLPSRVSCVCVCVCWWKTEGSRRAHRLDNAICDADTLTCELTFSHFFDDFMKEQRLAGHTHSLSVCLCECVCVCLLKGKTKGKFRFFKSPASRRRLMSHLHQTGPGTQDRRATSPVLRQLMIHSYHPIRREQKQEKVESRRGASPRPRHPAATNQTSKSRYP